MVIPGQETLGPEHKRYAGIIPQFGAQVSSKTFLML